MICKDRCPPSLMDHEKFNLQMELNQFNINKMRKPLRINKVLHRNEGRRNKALRGRREVHMVLKFDSEEEYTKFKDELKAWYYEDEEPVKQTPKKKPGRPKKAAKKDI